MQYLHNYVTTISPLKMIKNMQWYNEDYEQKSGNRSHINLAIIHECPKIVLIQNLSCSHIHALK